MEPLFHEARDFPAEGVLRSGRCALIRLLENIPWFGTGRCTSSCTMTTRSAVLGARKLYSGVRYWLIHWLLSGVALLVVSAILPGIQVDGIGAALIAALVIGLVTATLGLVLKIVFLPFIILTLGLVYFLINGLMLKLASEVVPGFRVNGCLPAVLGSILLTIVDYILNRLVGL
jgi:putative membrane protein